MVDDLLKSSSFDLFAIPGFRANFTFFRLFFFFDRLFELSSDDEEEDESSDGGSLDGGDGDLLLSWFFSSLVLRSTGDSTLLLGLFDFLLVLCCNVGFSPMSSSSSSWFVPFFKSVSFVAWSGVGVVAPFFCLLFLVVFNLVVVGVIVNFDACWSAEEACYYTQLVA